jgi:hypothetical protein
MKNIFAFSTDSNSQLAAAFTVVRRRMNPLTGGVSRDFPGFSWCVDFWLRDSVKSENGINRNHLLRLNSIDNLGELLEFSLGRAKVENPAR